MSITLKAVLAAAAIGFATVGAASADTTFNATFTYNPDLSPEVTYTAFERLAQHACRVDSRNAGGLGGKFKYERACQAEILANAVAATKSVELISLHAARTEPHTESVMASLK